jgi:hypothetical protein
MCKPTSCNPRFQNELIKRIGLRFLSFLAGADKEETSIMILQDEMRVIAPISSCHPISIYRQMYYFKFSILGNKNLDHDASKFIA